MLRMFRLKAGGRAASDTDDADDAGFTPAEIIIGVILVGILATGVTIKAVQLMDQARDSAAQQTIRAAIAAAQGVYAIILPGGQNNYAGVPASTFGSTGQTAKATSESVKRLLEQAPNIDFIAKGATKVSAWTNGAQSAWVVVNGETVDSGTALATLGTNPNGHGQDAAVAANTKIRPGDMIRMGVVSASGSSFCVVLVADSTSGIVTGEGYQAVDQAQTQANAGADCGAEETAVAHIFKQMPKIVGTDPSMSSPIGKPPLNGTNPGYYVG